MDWDNFMVMAFIRRNMVEPLYYAWNKRPLVSHWKKIESTQYLPEEILRKHQWGRLTELLDVLYNNNKFYRQRFDEKGVCPSDIKTTADIIQLPILTKQQIREHTKDMISEGYRVEDLMKFKTGGSTGKSLELYITEECSELRNSCARRHDRWTGWEVGEPTAAVWGNPELPGDFKSKLRAWLLDPKIYLDTMNITDSAIMQFAKDWQRVKPTLLYGHAHSIYILAEYVLRLGIDVIHPRGIISTSMMLMPHERKIIEDVFGIKVFDRYGCEEVSLIASECEEHHGMHLNIEHLYIEFIKDDGSYANPGEPGKIIVTDLMNHAMPFLRYQVEDIGVPIQGSCPCGRGLPLMKEVIGRTADFLIKKDGAKVAGVSLIENTLTKIAGIGQMQIVQETLDKITLNIVKGSGYTIASGQALKQYFLDLFGNDITIDLVTTDEIKPEASGKYRFSICRIDQSSQ